MFNNEIISKEEHKKISKKVHSKAKTEYEKWLDGLRSLPFDKLIGNAYEISIKENIVFIFEEYCDSFTTNDFKKLLLIENLVETIWDEWNNRDSCLICDLEETIGDLINKSISQEEAT